MGGILEGGRRCRKLACREPGLESQQDGSMCCCPAVPPPRSLTQGPRCPWRGRGTGQAKVPPPSPPGAALQLHQEESSDSQPFTATRTTQDDRPGLVRAELLLDSKRQNPKQKSPPTAGTPALSGCCETWLEELSAVVSAQ